MTPLTIGYLSLETGVKITTIRFYESIGLLKPAARTDANRRTFGNLDIQRLKFIKHARELGFETDAIRDLLKLQDDPMQSCSAADEIARTHLSEVTRRIASLNALKKELTRMINGCAHGQVSKCCVIEILADHSKCQNDH